MTTHENTFTTEVTALKSMYHTMAKRIIALGIAVMVFAFLMFVPETTKLVIKLVMFFGAAMVASSYAVCYSIAFERYVCWSEYHRQRLTK